MSNPPPSDPDPPPTLTPDVGADDELLAEAVDEFVSTSRHRREQLAEILVTQDALRAAVDADAWQLALRLDELVAERWADIAVEIARWAFEAGRRFPLPEASS